MSAALPHNLNIQMYSLQDILGLFDLNYNISVEDVKRAKKIVLMTHPDKSKLGPEYFLFYKKAFDILVHFYEQQQKEHREVPKEEQKYAPMNTSGLNSSTSKNVMKTIKKMDAEDFNEKFNQLFEENMYKRPDDSRNAWFKEEDPSYQLDGTVSKQNMNEMFERVKNTQSSMILSQYNGVENLYTGGGSNLYDELEATDQYVVCDPFGKLKYDDLRKVHKDQTVIAVGERDYQKIPKYASVEQFMQARGSESTTPMDKTKAERALEEQHRAHRERIMQLEHQSGLRTMDYEQKNKTVLANFLRIT